MTAIRCGNHPNRMIGDTIRGVWMLCPKCVAEAAASINFQTPRTGENGASS